MGRTVAIGLAGMVRVQCGFDEPAVCISPVRLGRPPFVGNVIRGLHRTRFTFLFGGRECDAMVSTLSDRKQRLRTLENNIRSNYEKFVSTGNALKEIRDDRLYEADGFPTWDAYLKQRVGEDFGIEARQVYTLIQASTLRPKLPDLPKGLHRGAESEPTQWSQKAVAEFARLAPEATTERGKIRDVASLRKQDVQRVAKRAVEKAKELGKPVTAAIVREAVNEDLGIKPKPQSKPEPKQDFGIDLPVYLKNKIGQLEGIIELLAEVPADGWKQLEKSEPQLAERLATVCDQLAALLRS